MPQSFKEKELSFLSVLQENKFLGSGMGSKTKLCGLQTSRGLHFGSLSIVLFYKVMSKIMISP